MSLRRLAPWLLFIAITVIYLLFPTRVYYWDGITFAQTIESVPRLQPSLVHPNHLIYNFAGYIFFKLLRLFSPEIRALTALQILSILLSAICARIFLAILVNTLRRLLSWAASYSPDADTGFNLWSNFRYSLRGHVRLFFGGRFSLLKTLLSLPVIVLLVALVG